MYYPLGTLLLSVINKLLIEDTGVLFISNIFTSIISMFIIEVTDVLSIRNIIFVFTFR